MLINLLKKSIIALSLGVIICGPCYAQGSANAPVALKVSTTSLSGHLSVTGPVTPTGFDIAGDSTLGGEAWWLLVFDTSTDPADGSVTPAKCYPLQSGNQILAGAFTGFPAFNNGVTFSISTTGCFTKTETTHAFISIDYRTPW